VGARSPSWPLQFGDLPVSEGAGVAQAAQDGVTPEFREISPAAGRGRVKIAVGSEHAGGGQHVEVGMPEQKVTKGLYGDDETGPAFGLAGALAESGGDCRVGGVVEFAKQGAVELEGVANQPGEGEHEVSRLFRDDR
jgi:hypothetical protein